MTNPADIPDSITAEGIVGLAQEPQRIDIGVAETPERATEEHFLELRKLVREFYAFRRCCCE